MRKMQCSPDDYRAVLLLGPTGAGKTPLGEIIQRRGLWGSECLHFDFGAHLREIVSRNRPDNRISRRDIEFLKQVLSSGALLEDEDFSLARRILQSFIARRGADCQTRIVLNGLPRHVGQARSIDKMMHVEVVVHLRCSSETVFRRIRSNLAGDRTDRVDDDLDAIRQKLAIFNHRTASLLEHYSKRRIVVVEVTAKMTPGQMWGLLSRD